jgi:hypothetical protein
VYGPFEPAYVRDGGASSSGIPLELMTDCRNGHKRPHGSISTDPGVHGMIYYEAGLGGPERALIGRLHGMSAMSYSNSTFLWGALSRDLAGEMHIPARQFHIRETRVLRPHRDFVSKGRWFAEEVTFLAGMPAAQLSAKVVGYLRTVREFWLRGNQPASATNLHIAYTFPFLHLFESGYLSFFRSKSSYQGG